MEYVMEQQDLFFYEERFLESWAGPLVSNPNIAIVELIANCWDAYSTKVEITWPDNNNNRPFSIKDNGCGMTREEFRYIWRALSYDRIKKTGSTSNPPPDIVGAPRQVFGKNGKGRFASFCFGDEYNVISINNGKKFTYRVYRTPTKPLIIDELEYIEEGVVGHGTEIISTGEIPKINLSEEQAREIIGSRFLVNPSFQVFLNGKQITFSDISAPCLYETSMDIKGKGIVRILQIDTQKADRTTKQHGIAWWVTNRAVGECKWRGSDYQRILDGRTTEAKRFTFIVQADFLNEANAVKEDWSWFKEDNETWKMVRPLIQDKIKDILFETDKAERESKRKSVIRHVGVSVNTLPPLGKERVEMFINEVVDNCPHLGEQEIVQLSTILMKLEKSKSRYGLLEILHKQEPHDLDALHDILLQWTIGMVKIVLDEIQNRLKLINELREKIQINRIDEVHELQPLFEKGLWMFGPQFESIEFTSNRGMTAVIRELFGDKSGKGSRNRPDFVILADCSIGFYARPSYDDDYSEDGIEHVVVVDLKTTNLHIGSKEKDQVWKYVKELKTKGYIRNTTKVDGFVLGDTIESGEEDATRHGDNVKVIPMLYDTILNRAEKRLLNLYAKVKDAPFLSEQREQMQNFIEPLQVIQTKLFIEV